MILLHYIPTNSSTKQTKQVAGKESQISESQINSTMASQGMWILFSTDLIIYTCRRGVAQLHWLL